MSYSFSVTAATKDGAKAMVAEQFAMVVKNQPCHAADEAAAIAAAGAFIDLLAAVPDGDEIVLSMHGSLGWNGAEPGEYTSSSIGLSAQVRHKVAQ